MMAWLTQLLSETKSSITFVKWGCVRTIFRACLTFGVYVIFP